MWHAHRARASSSPSTSGQPSSEGLDAVRADGSYVVHAGPTTRSARGTERLPRARQARDPDGKLERRPAKSCPRWRTTACWTPNSYTGPQACSSSAAETARSKRALGLAEQRGNEVTLSYRRDSIFRAKSRNRKRLEERVADGGVALLLESEVARISPDSVDLVVGKGESAQRVHLKNDDVFVMAGGVAPFDLLESSGVSFDPTLRPAPSPVTERGTGLTKSVAVGFLLSIAALSWALWHSDYYFQPAIDRPSHVKHQFLRPGRNAGLWFGILSSSMVLVNLAYLLRRGKKWGFTFGSLGKWMTSHVATGILAVLLAALHAAMDPRDTLGGHAFTALAILLLSGAIGRYFYAWVPRAVNGRELELEEARERLARLPRGHMDSSFHDRVRKEVLGLIRKEQWHASLPGRVLALLGVRIRLRNTLRRISAEGIRQGVSDEEIGTANRLTREAHDAALAVTHFEDLRAIASTWRYIHRWVSVLMVVLVVLHVFTALFYGGDS